MGIRFRDRLFTPLVTLWVFLSQALDPDPCCRAAVLRLIAFRRSRGQKPCSSRTGAYCKARGRLPEAVLARLTGTAGGRRHRGADPAWQWKGRPVKVVDGTSATAPDTEANPAAFPQHCQRPGLGFPLRRRVALFCLASGAVLERALDRFTGTCAKESFRRLWDALEPGDVVLGDRPFCSSVDRALLQRRGRRLGSDDHVVAWDKPRRPPWLDAATYRSLPETLAVREVRVRVAQKGLRTRGVLLATTLLDPAQASREEWAALFRMRGQAELHFRSLKQTLPMDPLRGHSPAMLRKELGAYLLAYNLIRALLAQAAAERGVQPWELSFQAAVQAVNAFAPLFWSARPAAVAGLSAALRAALAEHRVGDRPDRYEPRAIKRRPREYPRLTEPRDQARKRLERGARRRRKRRTCGLRKRHSAKWQRHPPAQAQDPAPPGLARARGVCHLPQKVAKWPTMPGGPVPGVRLPAVPVPRREQQVA